MSLARLLQLASPTLPVGAYSYSQGLEAAVEAGIVTDAASAERWIADVLELSVARMELAVLRSQLEEPGQALNDFFLASRETAELRAETLQMGYSLAKLLAELGVDVPIEQPALPTAFACAARAWGISSHEAAVAYLWSWLENQVMAALKNKKLDRLERRLVPVKNTRRLGKKHMVHNNYLPKMSVDPETYEVRADGELLVCEPAKLLPMAQRYFLF